MIRKLLSKDYIDWKINYADFGSYLVGMHGGVLYCIFEDSEYTGDTVGLYIVNCVCGLSTYTSDDDDIDAYLEYMSSHA